MDIKMSKRILNIFQNHHLLHVRKTLVYSSIRLLSKTVTSTKVQEIPLYMKKDKDFKISKKVSIEKLKQLLSFRSYMAEEIVTKYKNFLRISGHSISENYYLCLINGITRNTLMRFPQVLAELDISLKINKLKALSLDINVTAPLLCLTSNKLKIFVDQDDCTKRITLISSILEVEECEACDLLVKRQFLLSLDVAHIENNIKVLKDFGVTNEDIIRDLWVLKYSTSLIKERMSLAKQDKLEAFKTWMVRAKPEIFDRYVKRRSDTKLILGDNSLAEYLSERLECTEAVAKYLMSKLPALQNKSLKKMNEMIEFLFMHGFKPVHIRRVPKILLHSVETTRNRLRELEAQGMQPDTLYMLTKSQKQYMQYLESITKSNNKVKS